MYIVISSSCIIIAHFFMIILFGRLYFYYLKLNCHTVGLLNWKANKKKNLDKSKRCYVEKMACDI